MTKQQKKEMSDVCTQLEAIKASVEAVMTEWQDVFDNHGEKWQEGDQGQELTAKIDYLLEAVESIDAALVSINNANE